MAEQMNRDKFPNVDADNIVVPNDAFAFLVLQKGKLDPLKHDKKRWMLAYKAALLNDYLTMRPHLPALDLDRLSFVLDVGSGMGGIDILLHRHYGGHTIPVLLDGAHDKPVMKLHRQTYNDVEVAARFHAANGIAPIAYVDANERPLLPFAEKAPLVISLGSWCFHYGPEVYLDYVLENLETGGTLITDIRKDRPEWKDALMRAFHTRMIVHCSNKFDRMVFRK